MLIDYLLMVVLFIVVLGILVFVHEFGHFIAARMSGMRVDTFAIGMGGRMFGWNKINGFTWGNLPKEFDLEGNTDYRISMFPIGGYVKIAGMIDESMDTEFANSEPQPWEFRSKNTFQKAFTISAGVIMNVVLAFVIFVSLAFFKGEDEFFTNRVGYVQKGSVAEEVGFEAGDEIVSVNDKRIVEWYDFIQALSLDHLGDMIDVKILRDGNQQTLKIDNLKIIDAISDKEPIGLKSDGRRVVLTSVGKDKPAGKIGLAQNDTIISINDELITSNLHLQEVISTNKDKEIIIEWKRGDKMMTSPIVPSSDGTIGIGITEAKIGKKIHKDYTFGESIIKGLEGTWDSVLLLYKTLKHIIIGNIAVEKAVGGPIMIAKQSFMMWQNGFDAFISFVAVLSVTLAVINILPIPALDGGHLVFIVLEGIIRREVPTKIKMVLQQVGLVLLLALMAIIIFIDVTR